MVPCNLKIYSNDIYDNNYIIENVDERSDYYPRNKIACRREVKQIFNHVTTSIRILKN